MNGLLVVNNFMDNGKLRELYQLLKNAAAQLGVVLTVKKSGELLHELDEIRAVPCDFVLFWDKDVLLARMFEQCGRRVFNSADAIFRCDNKAYTALALQQAGVPAPLTFTAPLTFEGLNYNDRAFLDRMTVKLGFPLVVKELYGSFGQQVYLAKDREALSAIVDRLGCKGFLLQQFISSSAGRDVRVNVVGTEVVSAMLRYSVTGDFRSNISNGGQMQPYAVSTEQAALALRACRALGLDFAGVDVLFGEDGAPLICEVNSNPHFKSSLECTGVDMSVCILRYIKRVLSI